MTRAGAALVRTITSLDLLSVVTGQNESHSYVIEQLLLIICLRQNSEANWEEMFLT